MKTFNRSFALISFLGLAEVLSLKPGVAQAAGGFKQTNSKFSPGSTTYTGDPGCIAAIAQGNPGLDLGKSYFGNYKGSPNCYCHETPNAPTYNGQNVVNLGLDDNASLNKTLNYLKKLPPNPYSGLTGTYGTAWNKYLDSVGKAVNSGNNRATFSAKSFSQTVSSAPAGQHFQACQNYQNDLDEILRLVHFKFAKMQTEESSGSENINERDNNNIIISKTWHLNPTASQDVVKFPDPELKKFTLASVLKMLDGSVPPGKTPQEQARAVVAEQFHNTVELALIGSEFYNRNHPNTPFVSKVSQEVHGIIGGYWTNVNPTPGARVQEFPIDPSWEVPKVGNGENGEGVANILNDADQLVRNPTREFVAEEAGDDFYYSSIRGERHSIPESPYAPIPVQRGRIIHALSRLMNHMTEHLKKGEILPIDAYGPTSGGTCYRSLRQKIKEERIYNQLQVQRLTEALSKQGIQTLECTEGDTSKTTLTEAGNKKILNGERVASCKVQSLILRTEIKHQVELATCEWSAVAHEVYTLMVHQMVTQNSCPIDPFLEPNLYATKPSTAPIESSKQENTQAGGSLSAILALLGFIKRKRNNDSRILTGKRSNLITVFLITAIALSSCSKPKPKTVHCGDQGYKFSGWCAGKSSLGNSASCKAREDALKELEKSQDAESLALNNLSAEQKQGVTGNEGALAYHLKVIRDSKIKFDEATKACEANTFTIYTQNGGEMQGPSLHAAQAACMCLPDPSNDTSKLLTKLDSIDTANTHAQLDSLLGGGLNRQVNLGGNGDLSGGATTGQASNLDGHANALAGGQLDSGKSLGPGSRDTKGTGSTDSKNNGSDSNRSPSSTAGTGSGSGSGSGSGISSTPTLPSAGSGVDSSGLGSLSGNLDDKNGSYHAGGAGASAGGDQSGHGDFGSSLFGDKNAAVAGGAPSELRFGEDGKKDGGLDQGALAVNPIGSEDPANYLETAGDKSLFLRVQDRYTNKAFTWERSMQKPITQKEIIKPALK